MILLICSSTYVFHSIDTQGTERSIALCAKPHSTCPNYALTFTISCFFLKITVSLPQNVTLNLNFLFYMFRSIQKLLLHDFFKLTIIVFFFLQSAQIYQTFFFKDNIRRDIHYFTKIDMIFWFSQFSICTPDA